MKGEAGAEVEDAAPARRVAVIELLVFCLLIVPSLAASSFVLLNRHVSFSVAAVFVMLRLAAYVSLIAYFLWRNGEPRRRIGWRFDHPVREALLGCVLFVPFYAVMGGLARLFALLGLSRAEAPLVWQLPKSPAEVALAVVLVGVVAVGEETIFRGYLVLRFREATRSIVAAVLISSVVFGIGHGYEGTLGIVVTGLMGVVLALVYVWRRSLVASMTVHFLQDFVGVVLVPLLMQR